ncbi:MAG: hypothetical protein OEY16_03400 [Alphaproteobacteria bacterium]|nr:hypothetical protein [Alphaproteobacteria bacterium]
MTRIKLAVARARPALFWNPGIMIRRPTAGMAFGVISDVAAGELSGSTFFRVVLALPVPFFFGAGLLPFWRISFSGFFATGSIDLLMYGRAFYT